MSLQWQLSIWLRTSDKCGACTIYLFMPQHNLFFAFNWKIGSDYTIYRNLSLTCWIWCCCVHQNVWLLFQLTCVSGDSSSIKIYMGLIYNILIYSQFLDLVRSEFSNSFLPHNFSDRIGCDSFYVESPTKEFCNIRLTQSKWFHWDHLAKPHRAQTQRFVMCTIWYEVIYLFWFANGKLSSQQHWMWTFSERIEGSYT